MEGELKVPVGVPVAGIDSTVLVIVLHSTGNGLSQGKPAGLKVENKT
jgi:hypothetical protein